MSAAASRNGGFTLLELLVGMTIAAGLLLGLREAAVSFANESTAALHQAGGNERLMIERRRLERLVSDMQPDTNAMGMLTGTVQRAEFDSWCATPEGWEERCRVVLAVISDSSGRDELELRSIESRSVVSRSGRDSLRLAYLADASYGGLWRASWAQAWSLPLAVGVVNRSDTLILPVGER